MNYSEYENIKHFTYVEYCDYLQKKHGLGEYDYMTKSWNKNTKCTRTKEGLIAHHKYENCAVMLSNKEFAMLHPFEWQIAKNIVFCDYLEHLLLHVLICEYPSEEKSKFEAVGFGGVVNFIVPELNDLYSGWISNQEWQKRCHDLIKGDKDTYLTIIKRLNALAGITRFILKTVY